MSSVSELVFIGEEGTKIHKIVIVNGLDIVLPAAIDHTLTPAYKRAFNVH